MTSIAAVSHGWTFERGGQALGAITALKAYAALLGVKVVIPSASEFLSGSVGLSKILTDNRSNESVLTRLSAPKHPFAAVTMELATVLKLKRIFFEAAWKWLSSTASSSSAPPRPAPAGLSGPLSETAEPAKIVEDSAGQYKEKFNVYMRLPRLRQQLDLALDGAEIGFKFQKWNTFGAGFPSDFLLSPWASLRLLVELQHGRIGICAEHVAAMQDLLYGMCWFPTQLLRLAPEMALPLARGGDRQNPLVFVPG